jgi:hypothetical protein
MDKFFAKKTQPGQQLSSINTSSKAADHEMKDESTPAFEPKPKFTPWVEK